MICVTMGRRQITIFRNRTGRLGFQQLQESFAGLRMTLCELIELSDQGLGKRKGLMELQDLRLSGSARLCRI